MAVVATRWGAVAIVCALALSCRPDGVFQCSNDNQCSNQRRPGFCEVSGLCSFPDANCKSGRRYAEHSAELSGLCVPDNGEMPSTWGGASGEGGGTTDAMEMMTAEGSDSDSTDGNALDCVWWDAAWEHRAALHATELDSSETLTEFVTLVTLQRVCC